MGIFASLYVCMYVCVYVRHVYMGGSQNRVSDCRKLELQMVESHHVHNGAESRSSSRIASALNH